MMERTNNRDAKIVGLLVRHTFSFIRGLGNCLICR